MRDLQLRGGESREEPRDWLVISLEFKRFVLSLAVMRELRPMEFRQGLKPGSFVGRGRHD
jgi:hypothetical protein